jgi:Transposase IS116/IS110/IS902 family/Transposase
VHPLGLHWDTRRVKNDVRDATELAHRLRRNDVPEAWIAPAPVRELRELVRYRAKLTALRTSAKAQVHAVMAKLGILPPLGDMFGPGGQKLLDAMDFPGVYGLRVESLRDLLEIYERELIVVEGEIHRWLHDDVGYRAIQALHGIGPITAAILVAEIGDIGRFRSARHLCSWAGMTPPVARVRHQVQPGPHLQAGIDDRSLGGGRGRGPLSRRRGDRPRLSPDRRAAREQDRPRGGGQETAHPRLLRAARRRHPLPAPRGRVSTLGHSQDASSRIAVAPTAWWRGRRIE